MKKSKERLDAEATHQMTRKQKLSNFWFYYRWIIMGSAAAAVLLVIFVNDMLNNVKPDYNIALLTPSYITDETRQQLEVAITAHAVDINGDGKTVASVSTYQLPINGNDPADPNTHMANVTKLTVDIQSADSIIYITDGYEQYQEMYDIFESNGAALADCAAFDEFLATERAEQLGELRICRRVVNAEIMEKKPEIAKRKMAADDLFIRLTE